MSKKIQYAFEMLVKLIDGGAEFPDAEWKVVQRWHLSDWQRQQVIALYNEKH
jgi:hypothetical protein